MKKTHLLFLLLLLAFSACASLCAQTFSLITGRESVTSLDGLWRFQTGDDPSWANPNYDDSRWPLLRSDEPWSLQGYPGYSGMAWYRFCVIVPADTDQLSLMLPHIRTSYQLYANGFLIGTYGKMPPTAAAYNSDGYNLYKLPRAEKTARTVKIAIRIWHWSGWSMYRGGGPVTGGGLIGPSEMVEAWAADKLHAELWDLSSSMILALLQMLAGIAALALFLLRRSEKEYLWFSVFILLAGAGNAWFLLYRTSHVWNVVLSNDINDGIRAIVANLAEIFFYFHLLKGKRTPLYWAAVVSLLCLMVLVGPFLFGHFLWWQLHLSSAATRNGLQALLRLPMYAWILILLFTRARQNLPDARLLLAPVLMQKSVELFQTTSVVTFNMGWQHRLGYSIPLSHLPFEITFQQAADVLFMLAVLAILIFRFTRTRSEEERYAGEFEAARSVQSLLVPAAEQNTPGFAVESVYLPASEVGGDFFQVLPGADGSLLIVVGDVSGKGLKAAMTVSAIVGALRGCMLRAPVEVLAYLDRVLLGQTGGFVTCCATLIAADGTITVANAGHLAPYLNGEELCVPSGLPLGITAGATYEGTSCQLDPGDRLTYVSDGVVEARNASGELYGFERTRTICVESAQAIAETAREFGQEDDITVLSVTRTARLEAVPA